MNFIERTERHYYSGRKTPCVNPKRRDLIKAAVKNAAKSWFQQKRRPGHLDAPRIDRPQPQGHPDRPPAGNSSPTSTGIRPTTSPLDAETFAMILEDALALSRKKDSLYSPTGSWAPTAATPCRCAPSATGRSPPCSPRPCSGPCPKTSAAASTTTSLSPFSPCRATSWTSESMPAACASLPDGSARTWSWPWISSAASGGHRLGLHGQR